MTTTTRRHDESNYFKKSPSGHEPSEWGRADFDPIPDRVLQVANDVYDAAFKVHRALGPGLLESVYEACLVHELRRRGLDFKTQVHLPVVYEGLTLDTGLRLDILVGNCVVVELKAVDKMTPLFEAQLLTYLKLSGHRVGLLINFNVPLIKNGIKRLVL
jgi:GxxExxY protein